MPRRTRFFSLVSGEQLRVYEVQCRDDGRMNVPMYVGEEPCQRCSVAVLLGSNASSEGEAGFGEELVGPFFQYIVSPPGPVKSWATYFIWSFQRSYPLFSKAMLVASPSRLPIDSCFLSSEEDRLGMVPQHFSMASHRDDLHSGNNAHVYDARKLGFGLNHVQYETGTIFFITHSIVPSYKNFVEQVFIFFQRSSFLGDFSFFDDIVSRASEQSRETFQGQSYPVASPS